MLYFITIIIKIVSSECTIILKGVTVVRLKREAQIKIADKLLNYYCDCASFYFPLMALQTNEDLYYKYNSSCKAKTMNKY